MYVNFQAIIMMQKGFQIQVDNLMRLKEEHFLEEVTDNG